MQYFYNWDDLQAEEHGLPTSLCRVKAITGDRLQLIWAQFQPGGEYETHRHPHEQFSFMISGRMLLHVDGRQREVGPGDIWHVPPDIVHGGELLGDEPVVFVDVFTPVRREVLKEMRRNRAKRLGASDV